MAVLTPTAVNELNNVYEIATTDRVLGGELGVVNRQAQSLLNTCKYLDNRITTNANNIATHTNQISDLYSKSVPVGTIIMVAHNGAVPGYLLCDGSEIYRTTYSALFAVIGTIYGGDWGDRTTFRVPDFRGRYPQGYNYVNPVGSKIESGLPNITGSIIRGNGMDDDGVLPPGAKGYDAFRTWSFSSTRGYGSGGYVYGACNFQFNASLDNPIYGRSKDVTPPTIVIKYHIKY